VIGTRSRVPAVLHPIAPKPETVLRSPLRAAGGQLRRRRRGKDYRGKRMGGQMANVR